MTIADDPAQPAIARASAIERLGRMLSPSSLPAVTRALNDPDSVVRLAAVEAIGATDAATRVRYLPRMLNDPVESSGSRRRARSPGPPEARIPGADRDAFAKALDEYIAVQTYNADRPEGRMNLAQPLRRARRLGRARSPRSARRSRSIPTSVEARVNLADVYRARGARGAKPRRCCAKASRRRRAPPRCITRSGLSLRPAEASADALRELGEAAKLAPDNARYAYVYAVALNGWRARRRKRCGF